MQIGKNAATDKAARTCLQNRRPAETVASERYHPTVDVLEIRAQICAFLWWLYQTELNEAVDALQAYAERSGLIDMIGQDAVQAIIAAPFTHYRKFIEPEEIPLQPAAQPEAPKRAYRVAQSTIDAFWYVVRLGDADYLAQWLAQHALDAPELHKIWKQKCSTQAV